MERVRAWLKQHAASEKSFARSLERFFREQAYRVADAIAENFPDNFSVDQVPLIFRPDDEHKLFMPVVKRSLSGLMVIGARAELQAAERAAKAFDPGEDIVWHDLPAETRQAIIAALDETAEQPYWLAIQQETERNLIELVEVGFSEGLSSYQISVKIREALGDRSKVRSKAIARTESTGALNAGHQAAMQSLGSAVEGKKWLAIDDKDLRPTHAAANGQTAAVNGDFNIGGFDAPYPGHFSLPAAERVNCRCVVLSVLNEGILAAAENPAFDE
jgi:uncharacterized protein with gpF-like domain